VCQTFKKYEMLETSLKMRINILSLSFPIS
jgi:hypothetical protein